MTDYHESHRRTVIRDMRGMSRSVLVEYFLKQAGQAPGAWVDNNDPVRIEGPFWDVYIEPERLVSMGSACITATKVRLSLQPEQAEDFLFAFRLRFLSLGG
jgi:hypothetical protein